MSLRAIYDINLLEFYENKTGKCVLLQPNQKVSIKNYFPEHPHYQNIRKFPFCEIVGHRSNFAIDNILTVGKGKLSICGEEVRNFLSGMITKRLDLYFDSCSLLEIESIFDECVSTLSLDINYRDNLIAKFFTARCHNLCFHFDSFEDKESILNTFTDSNHRQGWNPIFGYFCSIVSAITVVLNNSTEEWPMTSSSYERLKGTVDIVHDLSRKYLLLKHIPDTNLDVIKHIGYYYLLTQVGLSVERLTIN